MDGTGAAVGLCDAFFTGDGVEEQGVVEEKGVVMFSAEQLMPGFMQPKRFFNIGLYEYARVFRHCHPELAFPAIGEEHWPALE